MSSERNRVLTTPEKASLIVDGREVASATPRDVRELIVARAGSELSGTDVEFDVLVFDSSVWVMPYLTPGMDTLLFTTWNASLATTACFEAYCTDLPVAWRRRFLFLSLPVPRLGAFSLSTIPLWIKKEPFDFGRRFGRGETGGPSHG
jgi:hypothetical protein